MKLKLFHRHFGIHSFLREIDIPLNFNDVVKQSKDQNNDFLIDEFSIFLHLPDRFLPTDSENILLCVGNESGSTAQRYPAFFRPWGKYFDSYSLELDK